ncbi:MAG: hypothetical protein PHF60_01760 [Candidatus ainarchaeum sp.]|nr:hypothetical protein [Candidatus ainarchaeum sp.]
MDKKIADSLEMAMKRHEKGAVIALEIPSDIRVKANATSMELLARMNYGGVYISFQMPFDTVLSDLKKRGASTDKLVFLTCDEKKKGDSRCILVPNGCGISELVRAIGGSVQKLKTAKKFIFIDSMSAFSASKQLADTLKLAEYLNRLVKEREINVAILSFDSKDLVHKKFIEDIAIHADEIIKL